MTVRRSLDLHRRVDAIASTRFGLVTREQLVPLLGQSGGNRWTDAGRLVRVHRGVYRLAGVPVTDDQRLLAAVLAAEPGALASHRSAAWLWAILRSHAYPIEPEITVPNPLVTVLHLGAVVGQETLEDAVDLGLQKRLFTVAGLRAVHGRFGRCGRNGAGALWRLIDDRALGGQRPEGLLEPRMSRLLRSHGLPKAAFQYWVTVGGKRYRIDFAYPDQMIAIEVDGEEGHVSKRERQRQVTRQNDLVGAGWTVLRFTWDDVVLRPDVVARRIRQALTRPA
jgi:very-short-patch-repair endonuclease